MPVNHHCKRSHKNKRQINKLIFLFAFYEITTESFFFETRVSTFGLGAVGAVWAPHKQGLPVPPLNFSDWGQWGQIG